MAKLPLQVMLSAKELTIVTNVFFARGFDFLLDELKKHKSFTEEQLKEFIYDMNTESSLLYQSGEYFLDVDQINSMDEYLEKFRAGEESEF